MQQRFDGILPETRIALQDSLRQMLTWFLSPKSLGLEHDGDHAVSMVASHLTEGYAVLDSDVPAQATQEVHIHPFNTASQLIAITAFGSW